MVKLIKYFNDNYGQQYGNIDYPRTSKEMYRVYQVIKSYGIKDEKLLELLNAIVLPKPKTTKEREMFSECLYEVSDNGSLLNDLICKETSFLKLTKDDFEVIEVEVGVDPSSITEPKVTSMEVHNEKIYFYELTPKLDWINDENDFEKLGYNLKVKVANGEDIIVDVDEVRSLSNGAMQDNIISCIDNGVGFANNGKYDYEEGKFVEKNCFYIALIDFPDDVIIDFELELFKIDVIPTIYSHENIGYYLVMGKDGKLYKYSTGVEG